MAQVILVGPPPDEEWCVACLLSAKQRQWEMCQDQIQAGYAASGEKPVVIGWPDVLTRELHRGWYTAVCGEMPMLGIVRPLCWDHVAGINPTSVEPLVIPAKELPYGLKGQKKR